VLDRSHWRLARVYLHGLLLVDPLVSIALLWYFNRSIEILTLRLMMNIVETTSSHMPLLFPVTRLRIMFLRRYFCFLRAISGRMEILIRQA